MDVFFVGLCLLTVAVAGAQDPSEEVAFSAGLTHHQLLSSGKNVVYDRVMINQGSAYNDKTGVFTCPVAGVYVFQFHGLTRQGYTLELSMYQNDQYIVSAHGHTVNDFAGAGNSVILTLNKGDTVSVKAFGNPPSNLYGARDEVYTTFSGFLISAS